MKVSLGLSKLANFAKDLFREGKSTCYDAGAGSAGKFIAKTKNFLMAQNVIGHHFYWTQVYLGSDLWVRMSVCLSVCN